MIGRMGAGHPYAKSYLVYALTIAGESADAVAESQGLLVDAEVSRNPHAQVLALLAFGYANSDVDPITSYEVLGRSLTIARDSGNRQAETHVAVNATMLAGIHGDPMDALDFLTMAIRNYYGLRQLLSGADSTGDSEHAFLDRLGRPPIGRDDQRIRADTPLRVQAFPEINALDRRTCARRSATGYYECTRRCRARAMTNSGHGDLRASSRSTGPGNARTRRRTRVADYSMALVTAA